MDINLSATALTGGAAAFSGTDNIDADDIDIFVESGDTVGYQLAEDTAIFIDELAADTSIKAYIVADFNAGYSNGDIASYHIEATAHQGNGGTTGSLGSIFSETASADTIGAEDIGFSDGSGSNDIARDGKFSAQGDYIVNASSLTLTKSSTIISDPINGSSNAIAIVGAVIEYSISISNAVDSITASDIVFTDNLTTEIVNNATVAFNTQYDTTAGQGFLISVPDYASGELTPYTNAADGVEFSTISADWNISSANTVTISGITLDAGESATIKFRVTIQ
jgi:hypothetical protein